MYGPKIGVYIKDPIDLAKLFRDHFFVGKFLFQVELPPLMITHTLGAYEDPDTDELHFDVLK